MLTRDSYWSFLAIVDIPSRAGPQNEKWSYQQKTSPQNPQVDTSGTRFGPLKSDFWPFRIFLKF